MTRFATLLLTTIALLSACSQPPEPHVAPPLTLTRSLPGEAVRGLLSGETVDLGLPLRPQIDPDSIPNHMSFELGAGTLEVRRLAPTWETSEFADAALVLISVEANGHRREARVHADEFLTGLAVSHHETGDGRIIAVVEVAQATSGSGVWWQTVAVLITLPVDGEPGSPEIHGWLPVSTYFRSGADRWGAESAEIFLQTDGTLIAVGLMSWEVQDVVPSGPWREVSHPGLEPEGSTPVRCLVDTDRSGLAVLVASELVTSLDGLAAAGPTEDPWSFSQAPGVTVRGLAFLAEDDPREALDYLVPLGRLTTPVSPPTCTWVSEW